jgi:DNA-binding MarR family transcriptional regulator
MAILFTHISGAHRGRVDRFSEATERARIGRAADCEVRVSPADTIVSSHHAVVTLTPRGYVIQDLASRNGTMVNGQQIERAPISSGDTVQLGFGGPQVRFDLVGEPARAKAEFDFSVLSAVLDASDAINKFMSGYLTDFGLTASRFNTLQALKEEPARSVTQNELGSKLTVTGASVTGVLDRLERDHLVARETHPTDRRANVVRLTDEGETIVQNAADLHAIRMQELMSVLDESEKDLLVGLLGRLAEAAKKKY